jgi:hypothetical protein
LTSWTLSSAISLRRQPVNARSRAIANGLRVGALALDLVECLSQPRDLFKREKASDAFSTGFVVTKPHHAPRKKERTSGPFAKSSLDEMTRPS